MSDKITLTNTALESFAALVTFVLLFACIAKIKKQHGIKNTTPKDVKRKTLDYILIIWLVLHIIVLMADVLSWIAMDSGKNEVWLLFMVNLTFTCLYLECMVYTYYVKESICQHEMIGNTYVYLVMLSTVIAIILWITSDISGKFYYLDAQGNYTRGSIYWLCQFYCIIVMCGNIVILLKHRKALGRHDVLSLLMYGLIPIASIPAQMLWKSTTFNLAATLALIYICISVHMAQYDRIVEQENLLIQQEHELSMNQMQMMIAQIQPHFLYNSLTALAQLCSKDPKEAKKAIINFADYWRNHINAIDKKESIPFEEELKYVKIYLYLEQLRFGDDLHVEYDLQKTDFKVPMLSVQPFVENAINWGVGRKEDGGTVRITTRENGEQIELCVIDDGVGFDTSKMEEQSDGRQHIGVRNARIRFQKMCNGTVDIYSEKGKGTKIRINLPKGGQS